MKEISKKILIIYTQKTGGIEIFNTNKKISDFFLENSIPFSSHFFSGNPDDLDFIKLAKEFDFNTLLVVGGDGTFRRVVQAMDAQKKNYELGFYPMGSANILAKMHHIPSSLDYLISPKIKKIGAGIMNTKHLFFISAVFGSVAKLSLEAPDLGKKYWGFFSYILGFVKNISFYLQKNIDTEDKKIRCNSVLVCSPSFSKYILPPHSAYKNKFSTLFVKNKTILGVFKILFDLFARKKISKHIEIQTSSKFNFSAHFGKNIHIDGDYINEKYTHFSFEYYPEKFSLLVPKTT